MRLPSSTLQCSDTHNGECHASPCRSPREALLFEQHLDLTSIHSRLMTPLSAPSQLLISSPNLLSKPCSASTEPPPPPPPPSSPLLSFPIPCPFFTHRHPLSLPLPAKESSHLLLLEKKVCVLVGLTQSLQGELENQRGKSTRATGHLSLWVGRACSECACPPLSLHIIPTPTPTFPDSLSLYTQHQPHTHALPCIHQRHRMADGSESGKKKEEEEGDSKERIRSCHLPGCRASLEPSRNPFLCVSSKQRNLSPTMISPRSAVEWKTRKRGSEGQ